VLSSRHPAGWLAALAGLYWLTGVGGPGWGVLLVVLPGSLLLAGGLAILLLPGDLRTPQLAAVGGAAGILLGFPAMALLDWGNGALATLLSATGFVAAGWVALTREPAVDDVPELRPSVRLAAKAAIDEALLSSMVMVPVARSDPALAAAEVSRADELFSRLSWIEDPASFHDTPPVLESVEIDRMNRLGLSYEHLRYESGFDPKGEVPGRERWLGYAANHTAHAWLRRHSDAERPWVVCIHGFGMGTAAIDLQAFATSWLYDTLGLNVALPVLPVHGPRAPGRRSGAVFMLPSILNAVHAEAQAIWDVRRLISWLRSEGATRIGVYGLSLGGYTTALLAGLEPDLACAVAGVPPSDLTHTQDRFGTALERAEEERRGIDWEATRRVLSVVSPLSLSPLLSRERRYIFGGLGDRIVPPSQVRDLWLHWERPRIAWLAGGHVSAVYERETKELLEEAFRKHLVV